MITNNRKPLISIQTPQGKLVGEKQHSLSPGVEAKAIRVFKGIPYALPPVGERRWKPAEPAPGWTGERLATAFSSACIQPQTNPKDGFYYQPLPQMSEDCLYLNVWAPTIIEEGLNTNQTLPVMIWIHGGSLVDGAASMPLYDGFELACKGVVVVTINYRLNIFGYFAHPALTAESPHNASGNYGTSDQIQALKWVQQNIAAFGGDANNVTVFGESSGALSVSHLMASPVAKGLFHRAIMQSGYLPWLPTLDAAEERGVSFAQHTGKSLAQPQQVSLENLRALSAQELTQLAFDGGFYSDAENTLPVIDDWIFPEQISTVFERGQQQDIPVLIGFNSGETYPFASIEGLTAPLPVAAESYIKDVNLRYGSLAKNYLAIYPPDNLREAVFAPGRDGFYAWAAEHIARMTRNVNSTVWLYYFDQVLPWAEKAGMGAFHASELLYTFNHIKRYNSARMPNWPTHSASEADLALANLIANYWVAFANNGDPNTAEQAEWRPYTQQIHHHMVFKDGTARLDDDLLPGVYELHKKIFQERRKRGDLSWELSRIGLLAPAMLNRQRSESVD